MSPGGLRDYQTLVWLGSVGRTARVGGAAPEGAAPARRTSANWTRRTIFFCACASRCTWRRNPSRTRSRWPRSRTSRSRSASHRAAIISRSSFSCASTTATRAPSIASPRDCIEALDRGQTGGRAPGAERAEARRLQPEHAAAPVARSASAPAVRLREAEGDRTEARSRAAAPSRARARDRAGWRRRAAAHAARVSAAARRRPQRGAGRALAARDALSHADHSRSTTSSRA